MLIFITDMAAGGRQTFCLTMVNELVRQGVGCALYVSYGGGANLPRIDRRIETCIPNRAVSRSIPRLLQFVRTHPDCPCLSLSTEITVVLCFLKRLGRIGNPIYHRESMDAAGFSFKWRMLAKMFFPALSGMIVTSRAMADAYAKYYRIKHPVAVIRNPCRFSDAMAASPSAANLSLLLAVGRLDPVKGFDRLLQSFAKNGAGYRLEIWGDGETRAELARQISELGITDRAYLRGHSDDILSVYRTGGILVMSSYHEGLPNALIEGVVCGCRAVIPECLSGAAELMEEIGVGTSVVRGDFESNLFPTIERVKAQQAEVWETARQKLVELTRTESVVKRINDFIQG